MRPTRMRRAAMGTAMTRARKEVSLRPSMGLEAQSGSGVRVNMRVREEVVVEVVGVEAS